MCSTKKETDTERCEGKPHRSLTIAYTNWEAPGYNCPGRQEFGTQNATVLTVQLLQVRPSNQDPFADFADRLHESLVVTVRSTSGDFCPLGV